MKIIKRALSALAAAAVILTALASCSSDGYALKIGDRVVSREQYKSVAVSIKSQFLTSNDLEENDELWDRYIDESYSSTVQEYLDAMIQTYLITYNLYSIHFDELGLKLDEDVTAEIEKTMQGFITQYGSREALDEHLRSQGFTYEEFESQYYDEAKKQAVILYYFGPESTENPVSREALREYYEEYYTKVKHVFLSTKDDEGNDFSNAKKEEIGKKAQEIYDKAIAGEDFEKLIDEYNEDPGMASNPDGYVFSSEDNSYTKVFHNAAFDMKAGEIRLIQSNLGYHIMKKYSFTDDELHSRDTEVTLIENMMSEESNKILEDLKERIGVEYNNSVLQELSVVNLQISDDSEQDELLTDEIKQQLGLNDETAENPS